MGKVFEKKILDWLLGDDNPPIKFLTLTNLLHTKLSDPLVRSTHDALMTYPVTQKILQYRPHFKKIDNTAYHKYTRFYWQIIFLGHFLADGHGPQLAPIIEELLNSRQWISDQGGQCLTVNLLAALMRMGYAEHAVVISEVEFLAQRYLDDGGISCTIMDYILLPQFTWQILLSPLCWL
jgi:hypothetical protein